MAAGRFRGPSGAMLAMLGHVQWWERWEFDWRQASRGVGGGGDGSGGGAGVRNRSNIGERIGVTDRATPGPLRAPESHDSLEVSGPAHAGTNEVAHSANGSLPAGRAAWPAGGIVTDPDAVDGGFCAGLGDHRRPSEANIENLHFL